MAARISSSYDADSAIAGTKVIYAVTHQFGAARGEFGATRCGRPIPFGEIPARPFLGIPDDLKGEVLDVLAEQLTNAIAGRRQNLLPGLCFRLFPVLSDGLSTGFRRFCCISNVKRAYRACSAFSLRLNPLRPNREHRTLFHFKLRPIVTVHIRHGESE